VNDICVIIVSHNGKRWLDAALSSLFEHSTGLDLDVVVVDNGADGSAEYAESRFPQVRTVSCANHGFGHANNRALETADARYVLFLNPDTEFISGNLGDLIAGLDRRPDLGLVGVRQVDSEGSLAPSIRRFPSARNMLAEALGVEHVPGVRRVLGERELDPQQYNRETPCDWTSGSFMMARSAALESTGGFDERFFLFSEETDLCWRLKRAGWRIAHMPCVTIRHYENDQSNSQLEAQAAYARMQFARKHFPRVGEYRSALALRYALRIGRYSVSRRRQRARRQAARAALSTVLSGEPPFSGETAAWSSGEDRQGARLGAQLDT
jgi:N-acetylglucosaminyl-diphospho-decaprenol L-rhamnosyltransferase